jgi:IS5 family transposase
LLDRHRKRCAQPDVKQRYRAIRPKVERKIAHLMRRKHGGRRARVRGRERVHLDFALLAAGVNLARIARRALPNVQAAA